MSALCLDCGAPVTAGPAGLTECRACGLLTAPAVRARPSPPPPPGARRAGDWAHMAGLLALVVALLVIGGAS